MTNFVKETDDLLTDMDKWMYLLKHMSTLDKVPTFLDKRVFQLIFKISEVAKLKKEERMAYEASLKAKWDTQNAFDTVRREGKEEGKIEGRLEGKTEVVRNLIVKLGLTNEQTAEVAEVSIDFVEKVRADLQKKDK